MSYEEGDDCPNCHEEKLEFQEVENCNCHINPPCPACMDAKLHCPSCLLDEDELHETMRAQNADLGRNG